MQTSGRFSQSSALIVATRQPASCNRCAIFSVIKPLPLASMPLMPTRTARFADVSARCATIPSMNFPTWSKASLQLFEIMALTLISNRGRAQRARLQLSHRHHFWFLAPGVHSFEQVIADAQRVGYDGEPGIDRATRAKEACVHHVEIIHLVRFTVAIERARLRVVAEADGAVLMRDASERDALPQIQIAREEALVAFVPVD